MKIWEVSRTKNSKPRSRSFADKFWPLEVRVMNLGDSILYLGTFLIGCAAGSTLMFLWFRPQLEDYERWISEFMGRKSPRNVATARRKRLSQLRKSQRRV